MLDVVEVGDFLRKVQEEAAEQAAKERAALMETKRQHLIAKGQSTESIDDESSFRNIDFYVHLTKELHCDLKRQHSQNTFLYNIRCAVCYKYSSGCLVFASTISTAARRFGTKA